jgi:beta-glucosidase
MSLEEKVGMLWHPPIAAGKKGQVLGKPDIMNPASSYDVIINQNVRHFNLYEVPSPRYLARWHNRIQKIAERDRLGIPVTISTDPRHGVHNFLGNLLDGGYSKWPEPIGLAALNDPATTRKFTTIAGNEMRSVGIRVLLNPMADLATEPRWARINGTFGEDAKLAAGMTTAFIRGFQGDTLGPSSVACMTKHWPGGGPQEDGEDAHFSYGKNQTYPGNNLKYHLIPFEAAINAGTAMIMPYYGVPVGQTSQPVGMSFNHEIIKDMLRNDFNYNGVVCTDWGILEGYSFAGIEIVEARHWGVEHLSVEDKIVLAINAGVDQFGGNNNTRQLLSALENGKLSEDRIDESVRRLLKVKFVLGLFDDPYVEEKLAGEVVGKKSYMDAGKEAQRSSMVMLKNDLINDRPVLPLTQGIKLYLEQIDPALASEYGRIVASPEEADYALIRLQTPWEERDGFVEQFFHQGSLEFDPDEVERLLEIAKNTPTIFFIYLDRAVVMPELNAAATAIVAEFGAFDDAVLDVAFGIASPKGRLPFEIPSSMEAVNDQLEDIPFDSKDPLYSFGHGLSY